MMFFALIAAFTVTLQPMRGVPGGPQHVTIEARDTQSARLLATAQYGSRYRVVDVRRIYRPTGTR